jgi:putative flippase GtrA
VRAELVRMVRFAVVGASNTVLTLAVFTILTRIGVAATEAAAAGWVAGATNGYRLNRAWTFRGAAGGTPTMLRYAAVQLLGAALSGAGVAVASSDLELRRLLAEITVLPVVTLITYVLSRRLVFGRPELA